MKRATVILGAGTIADIIDKSVLGLTWDHPVSDENIEYVSWCPEQRRILVHLRGVGEETSTEGIPRRYAPSNHRRIQRPEETGRHTGEPTADLHSEEKSEEALPNLRGEDARTRVLLRETPSRAPRKAKKKTWVYQAKSPSSELHSPKHAGGGGAHSANRAKKKGPKVSGGATRSVAHRAKKK